MIQGDLGVFVASKTVRLSRRDSSLVVESFGGAVRKAAASGEPGEEFAPVLAQRARELLEWLESRAHRHGRPSREEPFRAEPGVVGPEVQELLFEQASADRAQIDLEQLTKAAVLLGGEILASLEEQPSRLREERRAAGDTKAADFLAADGVDGLIEELHDVKAVEHMDRSRATLADDAEERLPHVAGNEHDGFRAFVAEHVEEGVEGCRRAVAGHVEQTPAAVVELVDEREVLVALLPRQFVDADGHDTVETAVLETPAHCVLDAPKDRTPARPEATRRLLPGQHARPARQKPHERVGRLHLARRPWQRFDGDTAPPAIDPAHGVHQRNGEAPERHEREEPSAELVVPWALLEAAGADAAGPFARPNMNANRGTGGAPSPFRLRVDETGLRLQPAQARLQVHRVGGCWCGNPTSCTMHLSPPVGSTGARRAACGRDAHPIPRCKLRDERRATPSLDFTPTHLAEEPSVLARHSAALTVSAMPPSSNAHSPASPHGFA